MILGRERRYREEVKESKENEEIVNMGRRHRQLGLYLYLLKRGEASFAEIYKVYNEFTRHRVVPETIRHQLKLLERKGLIRRVGDRYFPVIVPGEALRGLFDIDRSRVGKIGSQKSLMKYLYNKKEIPTIADVNPKLRRKLSEVLELAKELALKGKREVVLDLLVHTLLPVRKTGVLWVWRGDEFLHWERKIMSSGAFHTVKFPLLSNLLRRLGFEEGIMCYHVLASSEARKYIRMIFEEDTYPAARSLFYSLKKMGLVSEGPQYLLELQYMNNTLYLWLKDLYGNTLQLFTTEWNKAPPPPLEKEREKKTYMTLGVQHVKKSNESSYFSRF